MPSTGWPARKTGQYAGFRPLILMGKADGTLRGPDENVEALVATAIRRSLLVPATEESKMFWTPCRVIAARSPRQLQTGTRKEWHPGELVPRVGFIVRSRSSTSGCHVGPCLNEDNQQRHERQGCPNSPQSTENHAHDLSPSNKIDGRQDRCIWSSFITKRSHSITSTQIFSDSDGGDGGIRVRPVADQRRAAEETGGLNLEPG